MNLTKDNFNYLEGTTGKLKGLVGLTNFLTIEQVEQILENQEIVERLKKYIVRVNKIGWDDACISPDIFEEILGEDNES